MDRKFVLTAFAYAILGLALGIFMSASGKHGQFVTHAHIMLVGFLLSFVYALCHKLWLQDSSSMLASVQFYIHQIGSVFLLSGLFLAYGAFIKFETMAPVLATASIAVFAGTVLMAVLFLRSSNKG